jgi:hypothetical protein
MKYLFFGITLLSSLFLFGQHPLKKYPVTYSHLIFHERVILFNTRFNEDKRIKEAFVDTKILSEAQLNTALKYAQFSEYPEALNSIDKLMKNDPVKVSKYKAYWIGIWTEFFPALYDFRQRHLIWIPKEENLHMEAEYIPKTDDGFYVIARSLDYQVLPFIPVSTVAANNIVKKLASKKMQPAEKLDDMSNVIMPDCELSVGRFYSELKNKYKLTDDEIDVITRSTTINGWPDSIKLNNKKVLAYPKINEYNYIKLAETPGYKGDNALFWVVPNQTFAAGFQPKSELGYFFVAKINKSEKIFTIAEKEDLAYLNSPWWFKNVSSATSYDPSTFTFSNSSGSIASSSSNNNNGFTTTTVNGVTVATGKLERTNSEMPPKVKLPSGCATKDMKERFGYVNDNDTRWGNYKKGAVIAAYNTPLAPKYAHVFNVKLQKNTTYNIGVIFSTKDRKGGLSANASYEVDVRSSIPGGYSWSNTYNNTGYIIVGNEDIVMTVSVTGSKYYDLRDSENPEPVCSIVYVDKLFH